MYVLLLITGIAIGTVTEDPLNTFDDLQACEKAAAEQTVIAKALQNPTTHFRCQRDRPDVIVPNP